MYLIDENVSQCSCRSGCLGLFCSRCIEQQNSALSLVQKLMERLEYAESLFPSGRAFATQFPLYKSSEFTNRVKVSFFLNKCVFLLNYLYFLNLYMFNMYVVINYIIIKKNKIMKYVLSYL